MSESFRYRAATPDGRIVAGVLNADSRAIALDELRRQRLFPLDIGDAARHTQPIRERRLSRSAALAVSARTLAAVLSAGSTLDRALTFATDQAADEDLQAALRAVHRAVQEGSGFAEALQAHPRVFTPLFITMVSAGEQSGELDSALDRLADHLTEIAELRSQVRASLLYPTLMALAAGIGIGVLVLFVVPRFAAIIAEEGGSLPLSTRMLVGLSTVAVHGWWVLLLATLAAVIGLPAWLRREENRRHMDAWRLRLPYAGDLEMKYATAQFTRALAMLLNSGQSELASLRAARASVWNRALGADIDRGIAEVEQGKSMNAALANTLPPLATQMIAIGEESGRLHDLCMRVAEVYDGEVRRALRTLTAVLEPAFILVFGAVVGFVALAMLQAIYSINRSIF